MAPEILDKNVKKLEISLLGRKVLVPLGDLLLRSFQFLYGNRISMGRFCWNNECGNCEVRCLLPGETREHTIRACMYEARAGMKITSVPLEFRVIMQTSPDAEEPASEVEAAGPGSHPS
jgi:hypothetical protein